MDPMKKRGKSTKEAIIEDVAFFLEDLNKSVTSIGKSYEAILHANRAVTFYYQYLLDAERLDDSVYNAGLKENDKSKEGGLL